MADYAEDAFFLSNMAPGPMCGSAMLRGFWVQGLDMFTPEVLSNLKVAQQTIERDVAYIVWSAAPLILLGVDTIVVREGKIVAQTGTAQLAAP